MAYDLSDGGLWIALTPATVYRITDAAASYPPDEPYPSAGGRFSDGRRYLLYVAETPEGAVAEWLRHHPEFLDLQWALRVQVSAVQVELLVVLLDVRSPAQALKIPFPFDRLMSSEADESLRYAECRALADDADGSAGIAYPSAAYDVGGAWNLALFGRPGDRWGSLGYASVTRPYVDPKLVRPIAR